MPRSVVRAIQILEFIGSGEDGLTHAQIAKTLRIPKSSVSTILGDLVSMDVISFDISTKAYSLGPKIISIAHNYFEGLDLIEAGIPVVKSLARATGESVAIYIQSGKDTQLVYKQDSSQAILRMLKVGARAPMYAIAAGKLLLSYQPDREITRYISSTRLKALTNKTITDPLILRKVLEKIRREGIAYNDEEFEDGVLGVAAPVFDAFGKAVAALCVVGPVFRIEEEDKKYIVTALKEKAAEFSRKLGFGRDKKKEAIN